MIAVADTTPLNYFILIEAVHVLPALFERVYAPSAVIHELAPPRSPEAVRTWAGNPPEWLTVEDPRQTDPLLRLGAGEAAAIALAEELKADWVLLDERKGSRVAEGRGRRVAGTLVIMEEAGARGLLDYGQARDRLVGETTFYVTDQILRESEPRFRDRRLAQAQQPPEQAAGERGISPETGSAWAPAMREPIAFDGIVGVGWPRGLPTDAWATRIYSENRLGGKARQAHKISLPEQTGVPVGGRLKRTSTTSTTPAPWSFHHTG